MGDNGESTGRVGSWKVKRNEAGREHPIQFRNGTGSEYKHKGFIAGLSQLKAEANSSSSSTMRENSRDGR